MRTLFCLVLMGIAVGCARAPRHLDYERFFSDWLRSHGESDLVIDQDGVGIAKNATRLKASLYGSDQQKDGSFIVETEFRIRLPSNKVIIEFVAGMGKTEDDAVKDTYLNFTLSTFHVIYKSFINPTDEHQTVDRVDVNGADREMLMGEIYIRGSDSIEQLNFNAMRSPIQTLIAGMPLSNDAHWIKIVYGENKSQPMTVSVTLDNKENPSATSAIKSLDWPKSDGFYMVKQFIVVK